MTTHRHTVTTPQPDAPRPNVLRPSTPRSIALPPVTVLSTAIRRAKPGEAHRLAALIATAFHPLQVSAWLVADPVERHRALYANFRIHVEHALDVGYVLTTDDNTGVAVWFPRDKPLPEIDDYDHRLWLACGEHSNRFRALDAAFDQPHPTDAHHHLAFLAVHPQRQSTGIGASLLNRYHSRLDPDGMPAYLEAANQRTRSLYARYGYVDHGQPIRLANGPRLWPMWRAPRRPT